MLVKWYTYQLVRTPTKSYRGQLARRQNIVHSIQLHSLVVSIEKIKMNDIVTGLAVCISMREHFFRLNSLFFWGFFGDHYCMGKTSFFIPFFLGGSP